MREAIRREYSPLSYGTTSRERAMNQDKLRVDSIFLAAVEKSTDTERSAYLDGACGSDQGLRERVERLLAAHGKDGSFLESPPPALVATIDEPITERPG